MKRHTECCNYEYGEHYLQTYYATSSRDYKDGGQLGVLILRKTMNKYFYSYYDTAGRAQSVQRLATGWTVRESNPGGGEIFRTCQYRLGGLSSLLYNAYRVFPGGNAVEAGVDHPPHLTLRLKKE